MAGGQPRCGVDQRRVVISDWKQQSDGSWTAKVPSSLQDKSIIRELFTDGKRRVRVRNPNKGFFRVDSAAADKRTGFTFAAGAVASAPDLDQVELVFLHDWSITRVGIQSVDESTRTLVTKKAIGGNARHYAIHWFEPHPRFFMENSRTDVDQPVEWCSDVAAGELIYHPLPDERIENTEIIAPLASRLIEVRGDLGNPVHDLHFDGIRFEPCNWQIPTNGYAGGQANYHDPAQPHPASCAKSFRPRFNLNCRRNAPFEIQKSRNFETSASGWA